MGKAVDWGIPVAIAAGGLALALLGPGGSPGRLQLFQGLLAGYFLVAVPWVVARAPSPQSMGLKSGILMTGAAALVGLGLAIGDPDGGLVLLLAAFALLFIALGSTAGLVAAIATRKPTDRLAGAFMALAAVALPAIALAWMQLFALAWLALGCVFGVGAIVSFLRAKPRRAEPADVQAAG